MLTKFSFGRKISGATFIEPLSEDTKLSKKRLLWLGPLAIIVGAFHLKFRGISGFATFDSDPPGFLIGGILGIAIAYYLFFFLIYLAEDYLKWKNDIIIETTNKYWDALSLARAGAERALAAFQDVQKNTSAIFEQVFFSNKFLEGEDEYLRQKLGEGGYRNLKNYLNGENGITLKTFTDIEKQPFAQNLGPEGARYLLDKLSVSAPENVSLYTSAAYLMKIAKRDDGAVNSFLNTVSSSSDELEKRLRKFQIHNLGLSLTQAVRLVLFEVMIPILLAAGGLKLVLDDSVTLLKEVFGRLFIF